MVALRSKQVDRGLENLLPPMGKGERCSGRVPNVWLAHKPAVLRAAAAILPQPCNDWKQPRAELPWARGAGGGTWLGAQENCPNALKAYTKIKRGGIVPTLDTMAPRTAKEYGRAHLSYPSEADDKG